MDAWARGEMTVDEMVAAGLAIAAADGDCSADQPLRPF
jgi:hypothetical protein